MWGPCGSPQVRYPDDKHRYYWDIAHAQILTVSDVPVILFRPQQKLLVAKYRPPRLQRDQQSARSDDKRVSTWPCCLAISDLSSLSKISSNKMLLPIPSQNQMSMQNRAKTGTYRLFHCEPCKSSHEFPLYTQLTWTAARLDLRCRPGPLPAIHPSHNTVRPPQYTVATLDQQTSSNEARLQWVRLREPS